MIPWNRFHDFFAQNWNRFQLSKGFMPTTIKDVARQANVGVGTVSRVINDSPNVSSATRDRVLNAIAKLDYTPSNLGRRLSLGKTHTIGVIAPFFTSPSVIERIQGIESALTDTDYAFTLFNVESLPSRHKHFRNASRRDHLDGLIVITLKPTAEEMERFAKNQTPLVLIDQKDDHLHSVYIDDVYGGEIATRHLIDLGHTKIGFISDFIDDPLSDPFRFSSSRNRFEGYCKAHKAHGLDINPLFIKQGFTAEHIAHNLALQLLQQTDPPTAIFAASDTQAFGVMEAAKDLGLEIPRDLSVIGYDDIEVTKYLDLTTIRQPLNQSGQLGAQLLLTIMSSDTLSPVQNQLNVELVPRGSTAPPSGL